MPFGNFPENDGRRGHPISPGLQRALVFVLLGPVFGVLAAFSVVTVMIRGYHVDAYIVPIAFFFSLIICAITGPVDGVLVYLVPVSLGTLGHHGRSGRCSRSLRLFGNPAGDRDNAAAAFADSHRSHRGTLHRCLFLALAPSQPTDLTRQRQRFLS
jgi:hypothetical protein